MYPGLWAKQKGPQAAVINADTGASISWQQLDDSSNQIARLLRRLGLETGDHISLLMENHLQYLEVAWAAFRSGLYITCINRYLTAEEVAYLVTDSGSKVLIASGAVMDPGTLKPLIDPSCEHLLLVRGDAPGWNDFESMYSAEPVEPLSEQPMGDSMLYSSGTTGRPKGIKRPLSGRSIDEGLPGLELINPYGLDEETVWKSVV